MNPRRVLSSCLVFSLLLCGCSARAQKSVPAEPWTEGFWVWNTRWSAPSNQTVDVLFVQDLGQDDENLPKAREYWSTYRYQAQGLPTDAFLAQVAAKVERLGGRQVRGIQLDVDCPTRSLKDYAAFLAKVRKTLPPDMQLSITALLDWFRDGTDIDAVIEQVDEFVPQFYDLGDYRTEAIGAPVDAEKWSPVFQRFGKRFRIGVSTFGRGRLPFSSQLYRVITPLDVANDPRYKLSTIRNASGEMILNYDPPPGEKRVQFIVPTPESVRGAVESGKKMGASGVLFFRWPRGGESLVMPPEEAVGGSLPQVAVEARRGDCVGACSHVASCDVHGGGSMKRWVPFSS